MKTTRVVLTHTVFVPVDIRMEVDYDFSAKESAIFEAKVAADTEVRVRDIYKTLFTENSVKKFDEKICRLATLKQNDLYLRGEVNFSGFMPKERFIELMVKKERPISMDYKNICDKLIGLCAGSVTFAGGLGGFYMTTPIVFSEKEFIKATDGLINFEKDKNVYFLTKRDL